MFSSAFVCVCLSARYGDNLKLSNVSIRKFVGLMNITQGKTD
jgi:hypothetical protein